MVCQFIDGLLCPICCCYGAISNPSIESYIAVRYIPFFKQEP